MDAEISVCARERESTETEQVCLLRRLSSTDISVLVSTLIPKPCFLNPIFHKKQPEVPTEGETPVPRKKE